MKNTVSRRGTEDHLIQLPLFTDEKTEVSNCLRSFRLVNNRSGSISVLIPLYHSFFQQIVIICEMVGAGGDTRIYKTVITLKYFVVYSKEIRNKLWKYNTSFENGT